MEIKQIKVKKIKTKNRRIVSGKLPGTKSLKLLDELKKYEPLTSINQLPVGIKKTYDYYVEDIDGNKFLDGSSGVVVTNVGHSPKCITESVKKQLKEFHYAYSFPYEKRVELSKLLVKISPDNIDQVLFLTTGSEANEAAIKVARKYNEIKYHKDKKIIIGFKGAFHGKTMGAQMAGGIDKLKAWIGYQDPGLIQVEYPNCYRCWKGRDKYENCTADCLGLLEDAFKKNKGKVAAVITETFQGRDIIFTPPDFYRGVEKIVKENDALFIVDEIQAAFGRIGKVFGFENYAVTPNLICCGKGISGGLPLSALLGEKDILNSFGEGEMTTTHSADPICVSATLASVKKITEKDKALIKNCLKNEVIFEKELNKIKDKNAFVGDVRGKGMIWGMEIVKDKKTKEPYPELADIINFNIFKRGVLLKVPRGQHHNVININPPLITPESAVREIISVVNEAFEEVL